MSIRIKYLGQVGFFIRTENVSIAIDPVLNEIVENGEDLRLYPPVMAPEDLRVDFILCTHDHIDHMAIPTIVKCLEANRTTRVIVPMGCVKQLVEAGVNMIHIVGINEHDSVSFFGEQLVVEGVSAAHPVHSVDEDGNDKNLVYSIYMDGKQLVHFGDTYLTDRLLAELKRMGPIDMAFLPINGRDEIRDAKGIIGNLSAVEAAELCNTLGVNVAVPTHFDMIKGNTADPEEFVNALTSLNPAAKCVVPKFNVRMEL